MMGMLAIGIIWLPTVLTWELMTTGVLHPLKPVEGVELILVVVVIRMMLRMGAYSSLVVVR